MTAREEEKSSFKVVDRRSIVEEDDGCCGGHHHHHDAPTETEHSHAPKGRPVMSFALFIQSLAHQAMMGLGIVPWPDSGLVKIELDLAKETIDILAIMKDKTKNNLSAEEQTMLDSLLYQLQIAFVEIAKNPSANSPIIK